MAPSDSIDNNNDINSAHTWYHAYPFYTINNPELRDILQKPTNIFPTNVTNPNRSKISMQVATIVGSLVGHKSHEPELILHHG